MTLKEDERKEVSKLYMEKAYQALRTAKIIMEHDPASSVARTYYSMFYAAQSALVMKGITDLHRHEGVNSNFGQQFVKTGLFPKEMFRTLGKVEQNRYEADYNPKAKFSAQDAQDSIGHAEKFIDMVEKMMAKER